jgi:hypothetical protein
MRKSFMFAGLWMARAARPTGAAREPGLRRRFLR